MIQHCEAPLGDYSLAKIASDIALDTRPVYTPPDQSQTVPRHPGEQKRRTAHERYGKSQLGGIGGGGIPKPCPSVIKIIYTTSACLDKPRSSPLGAREGHNNAKCTTTDILPTSRKIAHFPDLGGGGHLPW